MQKLNNDQLRQLYFERSTPSKSFRERRDHIKNSSRQPFFDTNTNYERFSKDEINRFEKFFNTYVYPASQNYIFKGSEITPKTHKLIEDKDSYFTDTYHESDSQLKPQEGNASGEVEILQITQLKKELPEQVKMNDEIQNEGGEDNDDLVYLETLISSGINGAATPISNSLSEIFAEIIDNEKKSISNYESSAFDANIQMLFDEDPDAQLQSTLSTEIEAPKIVDVSSPAPVTPKTVALLPPAPVASKIVDELPPTPVLPKTFDYFTAPNAIESEGTPEEISQEFAVAHVEDFVPDNKKGKKKKKDSKLRLLDIILILIILATLSALFFHFRHLLPFDLPF